MLTMPLGTKYKGDYLFMQKNEGLDQALIFYFLYIRFPTSKLS